VKYESTYSNPAASLIQFAGAKHLCIACGQEHMACCGQCIKFVPEKVPCDFKCGHWVCNEGLQEYLAEREKTLAAASPKPSGPEAQEGATTEDLVARAKMFLAKPEHQIGIKKRSGHHPHIIDVKCEYCRVTVVMAAFAKQELSRLAAHPLAEPDFDAIAKEIVDLSVDITIMNPYHKVANILRRRFAPPSGEGDKG